MSTGALLAAVTNDVLAPDYPPMPEVVIADRSQHEIEIAERFSASEAGSPEWIKALGELSQFENFEPGGLHRWELMILQNKIYQACMGAGVDQANFEKLCEEAKCKTTWPAPRAVIAVARLVKVLPPAPDKHAEPVWRPIKVERIGKTGMLLEQVLHVYDAAQMIAPGGAREYVPQDGSSVGTPCRRKLTLQQDDPQHKKRLSIYLPDRDRITKDDKSWCGKCRLKVFPS